MVRFSSVLAGWATAALAVFGVARAHDNHPESESGAKSVLDFSVQDIDGKDVALAKYKGDVLLVVNVASK